MNSIETYRLGRRAHKQGTMMHDATSSGRIRLSARLTAALDSARALAACYVVLHHFANSRGWSQDGFGILFRFGQEAVLVFFVLSGFVIHSNERSRALHPKGYFLRRLRRIYPALIVSIFVATLIAIDNGTFLLQFSWRSLFGTLLSLQDISSLKPGVIINPYLDNQPLWSLSYEVLFYIAYPFVLRAWVRRPDATNAITGLICCLAYALFVVHPNHFALVAAYFLVWWCGAMAAEAYGLGGRDFRAMARPLAWLGALCLIAALATWFVGYQGLGFYPFLCFRHFAVALLMFLVLYGPFGAFLARANLSMARPAAALASVSYGLYVLHYPLLVAWRRAQSPAGVVVATLLLGASAYFADAWLNRKLPRAPSS
ncbi:MAG: acyltransferase [Pseudomonadota bacterium]